MWKVGGEGSTGLFLGWRLWTPACPTIPIPGPLQFPPVLPSEKAHRWAQRTSARSRLCYSTFKLRSRVTSDGMETPPPCAAPPQYLK